MSNNEEPKPNQGHGEINKLDRLYRDYDFVFSLYKLDADLHYRRSQMMLALETALLVALLASLAFQRADGPEFFAVIWFLGAALSYFWRYQSVGQRQFMELRKRMLRDLEAQIGAGINLFTIDRDVFFKIKQHVFTHSGETFPDDQRGNFSRPRIKGGTTKIEAYYAWTFFVIWAALLLLVVLRQWIPGIHSFLFGWRY